MGLCTLEARTSLAKPPSALLVSSAQAPIFLTTSTLPFEPDIPSALLQLREKAKPNSFFISQALRPRCQVRSIPSIVRRSCS